MSTDARIVAESFLINENCSRDRKEYLREINRTAGEVISEQRNLLKMYNSEQGYPDLAEEAEKEIMILNEKVRINNRLIKKYYDQRKDAVSKFWKSCPSKHRNRMAILIICMIFILVYAGSPFIGGAHIISLILLAAGIAITKFILKIYDARTLPDSILEIDDFINSQKNAIKDLEKEISKARIRSEYIKNKALNKLKSS